MIYIYDSALQRITLEVDNAKGIETGGILVGVRLMNDDIIITHATSPGPKAIKSKYSFQKDFDYTLRIMKMLYRKYSVIYLGEWHKHPTNNVNYSCADLASMLSITSINDLSCLFMIVGDSYCIKRPKSYLKIWSLTDRNSIIENAWEVTDNPEQLAENQGILFERGGQ